MKIDLTEARVQVSTPLYLALFYLVFLYVTSAENLYILTGLSVLCVFCSVLLMWCLGERMKYDQRKKVYFRNLYPVFKFPQQTISVRFPYYQYCGNLRWRVMIKKRERKKTR